MNIVMLVSNSVKNDIRVVREASTLADAGHKVTVFGIGERYEKWKSGDVEYIVSKMPFFCSSSLRLRKKMVAGQNKDNSNSDQVKEKGNIKNFLKGIYIVRIIDSKQITIYKAVSKYYSGKIDVVYSHDLDVMNAATKLKKKADAKLVFDSHELWTEMSGINYYVKKKFFCRESVLIHKADKVITVSSLIADELKNRYDLKNTPVLVRNIPEQNNPVVSRHSCLDNTLKLIYVGYYLKGRGIEYIVEELKKLADKNIELYLRISGAESEISGLVKSISEMGKADKIHILPFVEMEKVIDEIANYDIGILPYFGISLNNKYCLPNKFFQYLTGGVCVVSNDLPEVSALVSEYRCGIGYSVDGGYGLADVLNQLDNNRSKVEELKENATNAVRNELNWEIEKKRLVETIEECF